MLDKPKVPKFFVYILRTPDNRFYVGQTNNLVRRLHQHHQYNPYSRHYVQGYEDFKFLYSEHYPTRWQAMKRERELKNWSHDKKSALVYRDIAKLSVL